MKYRNRRTTVGDETFDSQAEAKRWCVLRLMERGGLISGLKRQVPYSLEVNGVKIAKYIADFTYVSADGKYVVEDVKGVSTPVYKLKKKLMQAIYGIAIKETK